MASEADKYLNTLDKEERAAVIKWASKKIDELNVPVNKTVTAFNNLILEHRDDKKKKVEEKTKVKQPKNDPVSVTELTVLIQKPVTQIQRPVTEKKHISDEVPIKMPTIKTIPVYNDKPAEAVPSKYITGVENMTRFKFRANDTYEVMMSKVDYIRAILKNKAMSQKKEILKYYEIAISIEKRSNQLYYYGSKNLKNKMYRFYLGRAR